MSKKLLALLLAVSFLLMGGCAAMFKKENLSIIKYSDEEHSEFRLNAKEVSTYTELKNAINSMVRNHSQEERLRFTDYEGTIHNDISQAIREVGEETALGSYAVEYMYFDPVGRLITHYEAIVYVSFKRTQEEIDSIVSLVGEERLLLFIEEALTNLEQSVAVRMRSADITDTYIISAVNDVFCANPASCVLMPEVDAIIHPASGQDKIIEITLNYGASVSSLTDMRELLIESVSEITSAIVNNTPRSTALEAYNALARRVSYDPDGELRKTNNQLIAELNNSAYGALVEGVSDSLGIALAYSAVCRELGIECIVVTGTLDKAEHSWNMIKLGDNYYHVDISADSRLGVVGAFGRSDDQMRSSYWWNIDYPECPYSLDLSDIYG